MSTGVDGRAVRGEATKLRILDAARDLLVEEGYGGTSTRAVAERAGTRMSLVHYHFGGKQQLLVAVLERQNEELLARQRELYAGAEPLSRGVTAREASMASATITPALPPGARGRPRWSAADRPGPSRWVNRKRVCLVGQIF